MLPWKFNFEELKFWTSKAFAKFCGSYDTLNGGHTANGLHYLTGGATVKIDISQNSIKRIEDIFGENPEDDFDDFFHFLQELFWSLQPTSFQIFIDQSCKYCWKSPERHLFKNN